ncbi:MAG TPA: glycosyltransferase family 39 protein [Pyrinomonadaceae bacterium]|nr:glycosyltransferase family 39 protein [Pyrinomonadaceae bacterium]
MIWPTSQSWSQLDRRLKTNVVITLAIFLAIAFTSFLEPGPKRKDMMNLEWVRAHAELGLRVTKGYNLSKKWSLSPTQISLGQHNVYVSAPPLEPLLCTAFYVALGHNWRAMRLAPILLGIIYLYGCFALAVKYLEGAARSWLMYFALSPMILIYSTYLGTDASNLGLLLLSYLCITNYLETSTIRWMAWAGIFYLLAFWISYMAFCIVPPILIQLLFRRGLPWPVRRQALLSWLAIVAIGFVVPVIHLAFLPGALQWAADRAGTRLSVSTGGSFGPDVSLLGFVVRQVVRFVTHYTPVSVALALIALPLALTKLLKPAGEMSRPCAQVSTRALFFQFLAWGMPAGILAVNHAFIHPFSVYYFALFFAFSSVLALEWAKEKIQSPVWRQRLVVATLASFLVISLARSLYAIAGGSLDTASARYLPSFVTRAFAVGTHRSGPDVIPPEQW